MKKEYLYKLFLEFSRAYGIKDQMCNLKKYQDLFADWLYEKQKSSKKYVKFFDYMKDLDDTDVNLIAEFGKTEYDTTAISMNHYTANKAIVISPHVYTSIFDGTKFYRGELTEQDGNTFVKYKSRLEYYANPNCSLSFNDDIDTLMTQIPFTDQELKPFLSLLNSDKTLFIGSYGLVSDLDREQNIARLKELYEELKNASFRDVRFCLEKDSDVYLSAIKVDSKQKVLVKSKMLHKRY